MISSFNSPVLLSLVGGGLGLLAASLANTERDPAVFLLVGVLAGVALALVRDRILGARLARWARLSSEQRADPAAARAPDSGYWGEVAYRIARSFAAYERLLGTERERLASFFAAIDASPNGVILLTPSFEVVWCNRIASLHFALDVERDRGQTVTNLVRVPEFVQYLRSGDFSKALSLRSPRTVSRLQVSVQHYSDGILMLSQDVTERLRGEQMQRDLIANASHELKTPLTVIAGFIETLSAVSSGSADGSRILKTMATQTSRMQAIIEDLLMLAEIEGRPTPSSADWIKASDLIDDCVERTRGYASGTHQISVAAESNWEISGSRQELQLAIDNLLANACRHSPAGTTVHIALSPQSNGSLRLAVIDDGPGIPLEHLPRLAERFYRVDAGRSSELGGTGLGLSLVKEVIQRHGGALEIGSNPGEGSSFALLLPSARARSVPRAPTEP